MRKLRDIDHEIQRAERRLATLRDELNINLQASRARARRTLSSPQMLLSALAAGFLLDRMSRRKSDHNEGRRTRGSGMSGVVAGLAAAALRAAISNPSLWRSACQWWGARKAPARQAVEQAPITTATRAEVMPLRASNLR